MQTGRLPFVDLALINRANSLFSSHGARFNNNHAVFVNKKEIFDDDLNIFQKFKRFLFVEGSTMSGERAMGSGQVYKRQTASLHPPADNKYGLHELDIVGKS